MSVVDEQKPPQESLWRFRTVLTWLSTAVAPASGSASHTAIGWAGVRRWFQFRALPGGSSPCLGATVTNASCDRQALYSSNSPGEEGGAPISRLDLRGGRPRAPGGGGGVARAGAGGAYGGNQNGCSEQRHPHPGFYNSKMPSGHSYQ
jgi:hypothetical protein